MMASRVIKETNMGKKWDRIARQEFELLDRDEQAAWADLRRRVERRR
jgi:hypothetical protein